MKSTPHGPKRPEDSLDRSETRRGRKRAYTTPVLVEYGSIGKMTQGASGPFAEGGAFKKTHCL